MPRNFTRKIIDQNGNSYCVEIPHDVNPGSLEDILIGAQEGIVKLQAYCLVGDVYRLPSTSEEIIAGAKTYSFYKKMVVEKEQQEDFTVAMTTMLEEAKNQRINKVRLTSFEGKPVDKDDRGYFIKWSIPCHICNTDITGTRRLSMSDGQFSRAQAFIADDKKVVQYRPGSKLRVCGICAPKQLTPTEAGLPFPTVEEVKEVEIATQVEVLPKVKKSKDPLEEILELTNYKTDIPLEYLKGYIHGVLKGMKG